MKKTYWIEDPSTEKPSVSLSLLMAASVLMIAAIVFDCLKGTKSSDLLSEFFLTSVSLYFGRRMKWTKKETKDETEKQA